jgi:hypothetical protein
MGAAGPAHAGREQGALRTARSPHEAKRNAGHPGCASFNPGYACCYRDIHSGTQHLLADQITQESGSVLLGTAGEGADVVDVCALCER